ncbi:MAG: hypothetical protein ACR2MG_07955 [Pyrinomonadaceae bacterium]
MKFHIIVLLAIIALFGSFSLVSAQADSVIGQITNSPAESFAGGISGDGRLVVFESTGNIATENPRNTDGNREIFIFDYAQRRIFQITDTKSLLIDPTKAAIFSNIKVEIINLRPSFSNDGRWIAFGSNVNSVLSPQAGITPGSFDAASLNDATGNNPLTSDGNTEIWLYQVPAVASVNLSSGVEIPITDLSVGTFTRATNTPASRTPFPGSTTNGPVIADDNRSASINDNGNYTAFVSNRDLVPSVGNASPDNNDEIFTFVRTANVFGQVTKTPRGTLNAPIFNQNPTISGNGLRVAFLSKGNNPIVGMTGGSNADNNIEIFYSDLNASGTPGGTNQRQITQTMQANLGDTVNIFDIGRRMSRDGRYIAFDSFADLAGENGGANQTSFALYLYDATANTFRRIGPRSDADSTAGGGDIAHYPGFTDTDANGTPQTLVFETRLNIIPAGTVAANNDDGLNSNTMRPAQIYSYPLTVAPASAVFTRLTKFPSPNFFLASTQPIPSNSLRRMTFTLALTEIGTGNLDFANEAYYFLLPNVISQTMATLSFATGASRIPVSNSPVPTPSPTATPSPLPSPSPTPQTPSAVQGISPGMLAIVDFPAASNPPITAQTAVGSIARRFTLPIELGGVTMTINGAACGLKSVSQNQITFVSPPGLFPPGANNILYPVVINNNGIVSRGNITIVNSRPDIFTFSLVPAPNGRARIFNVTNRVFRTEPFAVTTVRIRGGVRVPTVLRVFLTGVELVSSANVTIRVGATTISGTRIITNSITREPGVNTFDFTLPPELNGAGDVPIIISVTLNGVTYQSRLDDTAPRFRIL